MPPLEFFYVGSNEHKMYVKNCKIIHHFSKKLRFGFIFGFSLVTAKWLQPTVFLLRLFKEYKISIIDCQSSTQFVAKLVKFAELWRSFVDIRLYWFRCHMTADQKISSGKYALFPCYERKTEEKTKISGYLTAKI